MYLGEWKWEINSRLFYIFDNFDRKTILRLYHRNFVQLAGSYPNSKDILMKRKITLPYSMLVIVWPTTNGQRVTISHNDLLNDLIHQFVTNAQKKLIQGTKNSTNNQLL